MNDAAHFLFVIGILSTVLIAVLVVRAMLPKFFNCFRKTAFTVPNVLASTVAPGSPTNFWLLTSVRVDSVDAHLNFGILAVGKMLIDISMETRVFSSRLG